MTNIFPLLKCNNIKFLQTMWHDLRKIFRIVVTSQPIYEWNYHMAGKNIEKYHLWL